MIDAAVDLTQLVLDEATHTYRWRGEVVPGVTSILARLGHLARVDQQVMDVALRRGTLVHDVCEFDDRGELDEDAPIVRPVRGYLDAWRAFSDRHRVRWVAIEQPLCHPELRYAGKPDRWGIVDDEGTMADIKSGPKHPVQGLQLCAYSALAHRAVRWPQGRQITVHLHADGTYRVAEWPRSVDWNVFLSLLNVHNWSSKWLEQ